MTWELREISDTDCTMDDSGVYVVINRVVATETHKGYSGERVRVRADLMNGREIGNGQVSGQPIMSFIGTANAVRKYLITWLNDGSYGISREHASYIGYELARAEADPNYVQD